MTARRKLPPLRATVTIRGVSGQGRVEATVDKASALRVDLLVEADPDEQLAPYSLVVVGWVAAGEAQSLEGCMGEPGPSGTIVVHLPDSPDYARRRAWARAADGLQVDLHTTELIIPAFTVDVGGGGLRVFVPGPDELSRRRGRYGTAGPDDLPWFAFDDEIGVAVHLPDLRVVARCLVRGLEAVPDGWEVRLEFSELAEAARDRLLRRILERQRALVRGAQSGADASGGTGSA